MVRGLERAVNPKGRSSAHGAPSMPLAGSGAAIALRGLTKRFGSFVAIDDLSLDIERGEFISFLGPSGSGKSTTLMLVAGFERPDAGQILIGGRAMTNVPAHRRGVGMVFQSYALFPHMTVAENVAFALKQRRQPPAEIARKVDVILELVRLGPFKHRYPQQLSGGQQQRVAIARAIIFNPPVLLMDEPLSALDKQLREEMQFEIKQLHRELGITFFYVTHDQKEALVLSDRVVVMNAGRIEQVGTPAELYDRPANRFVATFIGEANIFEAENAGTDEAAGHRCLRLGPYLLRGRAMDGEGRLCMVRPEKIVIRPTGQAPVVGYNQVRANVRDTVFMGELVRCTLAVHGAGTALIAKLQHRAEEMSVGPGDEVEASWAIEDTIILAAA